MKSYRIAAIALLALVAAVGCHRHDIRVTAIRVPEMDSDEAARKVVEALAPYGELGLVHDVETNVPERTVTVTYDSTEVALKNLEYLIARAGFAANDQPALPPPRAEPAEKGNESP